MEINTGFLLPVFKGPTKSWYKMKAPIVHIFSTTNRFLTSGIRGFLCLRTDRQWVEFLLTGSFVVV